MVKYSNVPICMKNDERLLLPPLFHCITTYGWIPFDDMSAPPPYQPYPQQGYPPQPGQPYYPPPQGPPPPQGYPPQPGYGYPPPQQPQVITVEREYHHGSNNANNCCLWALLACCCGCCLAECCD